MDYRKIDPDGRLCFYYNTYQQWTVTKASGKTSEVKVWGGFVNSRGVQYYYILIDGRLEEKPVSVMRLHYLLNYNVTARETLRGIPVELPLQQDEVKLYYKDLAADERPDCPFCGGVDGIYGDKICTCAIARKREIKDYVALQRLTTLHII